MKIKVAALCAAFLFCTVYAQAQAPLMTNVGGRHTLSLDGRWQTIIDPYENGFYDYRSKESPNGYFKNAKPKTPGDLVEYDFDDSPQMYVPGDWNSQDERLLFYEGTVWYKKSFDYTKKSRTRLFMHFGGANYEAIVYLNGEKLGRHEGGFTPFEFEVTEPRPRARKLPHRQGGQQAAARRRADAQYRLVQLRRAHAPGRARRRAATLSSTTTSFNSRKGSREEVAGWVKLDGAEAANQTVTVGSRSQTSS